MPTSGISRGECIIFCLFGIVHMYTVNSEEKIYEAVFFLFFRERRNDTPCLPGEKRQDAADISHRGRYPGQRDKPGWLRAGSELPRPARLRSIKTLFALRTFPRSLSCQYISLLSLAPSLSPYYASNPSALFYDFSTRALKYASRSNFGSIGSWSTMRSSVHGYSAKPGSLELPLKTVRRLPILGS